MMPSTYTSNEGYRAYLKGVIMNPQEFIHQLFFIGKCLSRYVGKCRSRINPNKII